jgi:hypothetical protein
MNTTELLGIFRDEVSDTLAPYLWSDALVYAYIDDAQKQFCRDAFGIEDARSFRLTLAANTEWYALPPQVLTLLGAYDATTGQPIPILTRAEASAKRLLFDGRTGPLRALVKDMQKGFLRAYPKSNDVGSVSLETTRLSEAVGAGDDFEIDEVHHLNLLMWVKYRAYSKQDAETYDPVKATSHKQMFADYCRESKIEHGRLTRNVAVVQFRDM